LLEASRAWTTAENSYKNFRKLEVTYLVLETSQNPSFLTQIYPYLIAERINQFHKFVRFQASGIETWTSKWQYFHVKVSFK